LTELAAFAARTDRLRRPLVVDRVKNLTGVADVRILGERLYAMRIWLDRARLAAYNITVQDIEAALRAQNVEIPPAVSRAPTANSPFCRKTSLNDARAVPRDHGQGANGGPR
jgi:multidrug efflux pump